MVGKEQKGTQVSYSQKKRDYICRLVHYHFCHVCGVCSFNVSIINMMYAVSRIVAPICMSAMPYFSILIQIQGENVLTCFHIFLRGRTSFKPDAAQFLFRVSNVPDFFTGAAMRKLNAGTREARRGYKNCKHNTTKKQNDIIGGRRKLWTRALSSLNSIIFLAKYLKKPKKCGK